MYKNLKRTTSYLNYNSNKHFSLNQLQKSHKEVKCRLECTPYVLTARAKHKQITYKAWQYRELMLISDYAIKNLVSVSFWVVEFYE